MNRLAIQQKILDFVTSKGHVYRSELEAWMRGFMSRNMVEITYRQLLDSKTLAKITEHRTSRVIVGIPAEIYQLYQMALAGTYRN